MATIPTNNTSARIMPQVDKQAQTWAPLCTPQGMLVRADGHRAAVPVVLCALIDAFLTRWGSKATFAVVGHGVRAVADGVTGQGSPFFIEARGMVTGEVYIYGGAPKLDAIRQVMGGGIGGVRVENKGGLYITLLEGCAIDALLDFLSLHGSVRGPVGYRADMGAPPACDPVTFVGADGTVNAPLATKPAKAKRAKREATA